MSASNEIYPDREEREPVSIKYFDTRTVMDEFRNRVVAEAPLHVLIDALENRGYSSDETVFNRMLRASSSRSERWMRGSVGFTALERAAEVAGEVGELVNVVKKIRREQMAVVGNTPNDQGAALFDKAEREAGDVFITLLNLANDLDIDLLRGIKNAFNDKSEQLGFPERI